MAKSPRRKDLTITKSTAAELKAASQVTSNDMARAAEEWKSVAPAQFRDIIDAVVTPDE